MVHGGMGDMADVEHRGNRCGYDGRRRPGGVAEAFDEHLRGTAAPARLDHLDARELLPPRKQHLGQGGGIAALERVVEFGVAGEAVKEVGGSGQPSPPAVAPPGASAASKANSSRMSSG